MGKTLARFVTLLLVPCLIGDPVVASVLMPTEPASHTQNLSVFDKQALIPALTVAVFLGPVVYPDVAHWLKTHWNELALSASLIIPAIATHGFGSGWRRTNPASAVSEPRPARVASDRDPSDSKRAALFTYLRNQGNDPKDIQKVLEILEEYSQKGKELLLEIGGGSTVVAHEIAQKNLHMGIITFDVYDEKETSSYRKVSEEFMNRKLKVQKEPLPNCAVIRADNKIYRHLPAGLWNSILLVAPDHSVYKLRARQLQRVLKPEGQIILKPFHAPWPMVNTTSPNYPKEIKFASLTFSNVGTPAMFGIDLDATSDFRSGDHLFVWKKGLPRVSQRVSKWKRFLGWWQGSQLNKLPRSRFRKMAVSA